LWLAVAIICSAPEAAKRQQRQPLTQGIKLQLRAHSRHLRPARSGRFNKRMPTAALSPEPSLKSALKTSSVFQRSKPKADTKPRLIVEPEAGRQ